MHGIAVVSIMRKGRDTLLKALLGVCEHHYVRAVCGPVNLHFLAPPVLVPVLNLLFNLACSSSYSHQDRIGQPLSSDVKMQAPGL